MNIENTFLIKNIDEKIRYSKEDYHIKNEELKELPDTSVSLLIYSDIHADIINFYYSSLGYSVIINPRNDGISKIFYITICWNLDK